MKLKMNRALGHVCAHIQAKLGHENILRMVRSVRWHCPPDPRFEIQTLKVWGRARYLSVTEFYEWMGKKHFGFFQTAETGKWTMSSSVKGKAAVLTTTLGLPPLNFGRIVVDHLEFNSTTMVIRPRTLSQSSPLSRKSKHWPYGFFAGPPSATLSQH